MNKVLGMVNMGSLGLVCQYLIFAVLCSVPTLLTAQQPNILVIISDDLNTKIGPYMDIDNHTPNPRTITMDQILPK